MGGGGGGGVIAKQQCLDKASPQQMWACIFMIFSRLTQAMS